MPLIELELELIYAYMTKASVRGGAAGRLPGSDLGRPAAAAAQAASVPRRRSCGLSYGPGAAARCCLIKVIWDGGKRGSVLQE